MMLNRKKKTGQKPVFLSLYESSVIEKRIFGKIIIKPRNDITWLGIKNNGKVVAYLGYWLHGRNCKVVISGVLPRYRGYGLQKRLIREVLLRVAGESDRIWAEVEESNSHSLNNFLKLGFSTEINMSNFLIVSRNLKRKKDK
jgi:ribosomal protein S18 acetylase RimI-like enzyme